jgi:hypothetical protein
MMTTKKREKYQECSTFTVVLISPYLLLGLRVAAKGFFTTLDCQASIPMFSNSHMFVMTGC